MDVTGALALPLRDSGLGAAWDRVRRWCVAHDDALWTVAVELAALAHLLRVYNRGFNLLDEGFVLHVAERVMQGQVPYRDFFTQLTPGAFVALALVFRIAGPSIIVGRWITVLLGLAITWMLYWGARHVTARPVAALAALAFPVWGIAQGWFYPNYSWFALAAALAALLCVLKALAGETGSTGVARGIEMSPPARAPGHALRWTAGAGLLCGVAAFCKQNMGLYALVALLATWLVAAPGGWRGRASGALVMAAAAVPVPLALLAWLAANGALNDFYRDAIWIPLAVFPKEMVAPYPPFWPPWPLPTDPKGQGAWAFRLVCLLPPLPYALGSLYLASSALTHRIAGTASRHLPRARWAALAAWLIFGAAIWATAFPRADFDHIQVALGPIFVVGAVVMEGAGRFLVRHRVWRLWGAQDSAWSQRWLPRALACSLLGGFLLAGVRHARALHMGPGWSLRTIESAAPRAWGILLDHDDAAELNRLIREMRRLSGPNDPIAALPWNAGLYFLSERRNVTRFDLIIPASVLPEDLPEIERDLDEARLIVYWTARDTFINNTSLDDRLPDLDRYVMRRYRTVGAVNAYRLLVPGA